MLIMKTDEPLWVVINFQHDILIFSFHKSANVRWCNTFPDSVESKFGLVPREGKILKSERGQSYAIDHFKCDIRVANFQESAGFRW